MTQREAVRHTTKSKTVTRPNDQTVFNGKITTQDVSSSSSSEDDDDYSQNSCALSGSDRSEEDDSDVTSTDKDQSSSDTDDDYDTLAKKDSIEQIAPEKIFRTSNKDLFTKKPASKRTEVNIKELLKEHESLTNKIRINSPTRNPDARTVMGTLAYDPNSPEIITQKKISVSKR